MKTVIVWSERITLALLYMSVILISVASTTVLEEGTRTFLINAILFCGSAFFYLLFTKDFFQKVKQGIWFALFFGVVLMISTVKYGIALANHQEILFGAVYQMVILAAYGCMAFAVMSRKESSVPVVMGLLACITPIVILAYQNSFMLDMGVFRFRGACINPNNLGIFSVTSFCACLYMLVSHYPGRFLFLLGCGINAAATFLTGSRTALLALVAACTIVAVFSLGFVNRKNVKPLITALLAFVVLTGGSFWLLSPSAGEDLDLVVVSTTPPNVIPPDDEQPDDGTTPSDENPVFNSEESISNSWIWFLQRFNLTTEGSSSFKGNLRLTIWLSYLEMLPGYALFGTDYTLADRPYIQGGVRDPHNTLIYACYRFGMPGVLTLTALLLVVGFKLLLRRKKTLEQIVILALFASVGVISLLTDLLNFPPYYLVLALTYCAAKDPKRKIENVKRPPERILHVFSTLDKGGAESRTMDVFRSLNRDEVCFDFAVTSPHVQEHHYYEEALAMGGNVVEICSWKRIGILSYFAQWTDLFRQKQYQVIHCHMGIFSAIPLYAAWLNNVPVRIAHARDSSADRGSSVWSFVNKLGTNLFSNRKIYCSTEAANFAFYSASDKKSYFLPNAISLEQFTEITQERQKELEQELQLPSHSMVIGTVGNARPVKNHIFLVKAFEELLKQDPNALLLIVGRDEQDQDAKEYAAVQGIASRVIFAGPRNDIPEVLQLMDLFVLPSLHEGAPGSAIEAQAANVPCILSDTITSAVDACPGMVKYLSLDAPLETWATEMLAACQMERAPFGASHEQLRKAGYEVFGSAAQLIKIYKDNG